ncbi:hypothetical protein DEU56DRAFT_898847 [Suillus clintonianus]|uniref:uncharacterized protein n=1 Tax=Suillus clintonianus TaxID=1904413 RepID=UPI001B86FCD0|nr:uncharacterized protein DEU56DRAFT_898847 [Suillus clintonianus]KAG2150438.1 hypothetical protein DEU56DRAFT_898847 [Suillus clintonianus]
MALRSPASSFPTEYLPEPEMKGEGKNWCPYEGALYNANRSAKGCMKITIRPEELANESKEDLPPLALPSDPPHGTPTPLPGYYPLGTENVARFEDAVVRSSGATALQKVVSIHSESYRVSTQGAAQHRPHVLSNGWCLFSHAHGLDVWGNNKGSAAALRWRNPVHLPHKLMKMKPFPCDCMTSGILYGVERKERLVNTLKSIRSLNDSALISLMITSNLNQGEIGKMTPDYRVARKGKGG